MACFPVFRKLTVWHFDEKVEIYKNFNKPERRSLWYKYHKQGILINVWSYFFHSLHAKPNLKANFISVHAFC